MMCYHLRIGSYTPNCKHVLRVFIVSVFYCIQLLKFTHFFYTFQVGPSGKAVGIDHIPELVSESVENIKKDSNLASLLESGQMKLVSGDGRQGLPEDSPYDAIHVGAAAATLPQAVSSH